MGSFEPRAIFAWAEKRTPLLATLVVVLVLGCLRIHSASHGIRYVQHVDEHFLYHQTRTMVSERELNPHFFRYPSLPIYLTAGAIEIRNWFGVEPDYDVSSSPEALVEGPRFSAPKLEGKRYEGAPLIAAARYLFVCLGVVAFGWVALIARTLGSRLLYAVAPAILGLSGVLQHVLVGYQNVDTPTLFFVGAGLSATLVWFDHNSWVKTALVPGVLCGMATASKYNSGLLLGSCLLAVFLGPNVSRKGLKAGALVGAFAVSFVMAVPYAVLDFEHFRADVLFEIDHYKTGHPGHEGTAGVPQLLYYLSNIAEDFGPVVSALALVGIPLSIARDWRRGLVLLSFPVAMLLHMSTNRVNFLRTIAPVFFLVPVYATLCVEQSYEGLLRLGRKYVGSRGAPLAFGVTTILIVASLLTNPKGFGRLGDRNRRPDTRDRAIAWALRNTKPGGTVYVAKDLWISPRDLLERNVVVLRPSLRKSERLLDAPGVVLLPHYGRPHGIPWRLRGDAAKTNAFLREGERRASLANENRKRLLEAWRAKCRKRWSGQLASVNRKFFEGAKPRVSPEILGCSVSGKPKKERPSSTAR